MLRNRHNIAINQYILSKYGQYKTNLIQLQQRLQHNNTNKWNINHVTQLSWQSF